MKRIIALVLLICFIFCSCTNRKTAQPLTVTAFSTNIEAFIELNEFLLDYSSSIIANDEELTLILDFSNENGNLEKIYSDYYDDYISLDENIIKYFSIVKKSFKYDFSIISITSTRISYGGEGYEMYVYSLDGKKPNSFWPDKNTSSFSTYYLGDNWYYLFLKVR